MRSLHAGEQGHQVTGADLHGTGRLAAGADVTAVAGSYARGNENNAHARPTAATTLGPGRSAGYAVLNLHAEWQPAKGTTLFLQLNNALDRRCQAATQLGSTAFDAHANFRARPFAADGDGNRPLLGSTFLAPGAPRHVIFGLRHAFAGT